MRILVIAVLTLALVACNGQTAPAPTDTNFSSDCTTASQCVDRYPDGTAK